MTVRPAKSTPFIPPGESRIQDFDHLARLFSRWDGRFEQLSCGKFEATLRMARGRHLNTHFVRANRSLLIRGREGPGVVTVTLVIPESSGCLWQGRRLETGNLVVRSGEVTVNHQSCRQAANFMVALSEEKLLQTTRSITRKEPKPLSWSTAQPSPKAFARLAENLRQLLADPPGSPLSGDQDSYALEQACYSAAAEAVYQTGDSRKADISHRARTALVNRAEEMMRSRVRTPIGEVDLCALLGVSGRTLRLAFRERFGMGPMAYFQTIRLNAVREILKARDSEGTPISEIAKNLGFHHLGKFSGYYRRLFGELPSKTSAV